MRKIIFILCAFLLIISLINFSSAADEELTSAQDGITLDVAVWTQQQGQVLEDICKEIGEELTTCNAFTGIIVGKKPLSIDNLNYAKGKNSELGENLETFGYVAQIYENYGADSLSIDEPLKLSKGDIKEGYITFPEQGGVDASKIINEDYGAAQVILEGAIDYDNSIIILESGDGYHRAGTSEDKILKQDSTLTIEPLTGDMEIDLEDVGYFNIFGIVRIPTGSRIKATTMTPFKITHQPARFLSVQVIPLTATEFSFVRKDERLWLNGNGLFQVIEAGTEVDKGGTIESENSYDLTRGYIGKVYVDKEGNIFYDVETKEIDGETYVIKKRWQDIPAVVGTEKAGINIIKELDDGIIVINEEGKFFISHEDYLGEGKTDNFFIAVYEYGKDQIQKIKELITGK